MGSYECVAWVVDLYELCKVLLDVVCWDNERDVWIVVVHDGAVDVKWIVLVVDRDVVYGTGVDNGIGNDVWIVVLREW